MSAFLNENFDTDYVIEAQWERDDESEDEEEYEEVQSEERQSEEEE